MQFSIRLDVLGTVVGCRDNDVRLFARVRKHYCSRRYGEKQRYFSASATYLLLLYHYAVKKTSNPGHREIQDMTQK